MFNPRNVWTNEGPTFRLFLNNVLVSVEYTKKKTTKSLIAEHYI